LSAKEYFFLSRKKFVSLLACVILAGCADIATIESTPTIPVLPSVTPTVTRSPTRIPILPTIDIEDADAADPRWTSAFRTEHHPFLAPFTPTGMLGLVTKKQLNVRTGPGQSYPSVAVLECKALVKLTGRALGNLWYQIEYPNGTDGHGWAAASFITVPNGDPLTLPLFDNRGKPIP
jgi:uncharacterized protein YgiM (DUF1202 family)